MRNTGNNIFQMLLISVPVCRQMKAHLESTVSQWKVREPHKKEIILRVFPQQLMGNWIRLK